MTERH